ncbi:MAG: HD domain-containing protein [Bdellovibrionales bacterium]|nr:HD domain-containing protein [Bdellovibrionales bacterium]
MQLRDPIHGSIDISAAEAKLLDHPTYQRLRSIKQLGFAEFSFPGATHNRFLHSVGVAHLAGIAFDQIFKKWKFSKNSVKKRFKTIVRLAAFLHDIGHGPLSHATEEVMPELHNLLFGPSQEKSSHQLIQRKANHEDYTLKFISNSSLTECLRAQFSDISPIHISCLIDRNLPSPDDFFKDHGLDFRTLLSQLVSSEMDVDRMDYLERDAYFCGTNYGRVELSWLLSNLTSHIEGDKVHLALNRRALYTFDDFILARHHMHLMVYFHHKAIIYEELLIRYLTSPECEFFLPADIEAYVRCTDYALYEHLRSVSNEWAKRLVERRPFHRLFELHFTEPTNRTHLLKKYLEQNGISVIHSSSQARLSKYHSNPTLDQAPTIFLVDEYDPQSVAVPLQQGTQIFAKYQEIRCIDRLYVPPEKIDHAKKLMTHFKSES